MTYCNRILPKRKNMSVRDNRLCDRVISGMPVENWILHHETTSLPKILNFNVVCDTLRYLKCVKLASSSK